MNNKLKKWYLQFWALSLAIFSLSLLFFLLPVRHASASTSYVTELPVTANYITVPDNNGNTVLMCDLMARYDYPHPLNYDGVPMTDLFYDSGDWGGGWMYVISPVAGTHLLSMTNASYGYGETEHCVLVSDVDPVTPFANTLSQGAIWTTGNRTYGGATTGNLLLNLLSVKDASTEYTGSNVIYSYNHQSGYGYMTRDVSAIISGGTGTDTISYDGTVTYHEQRAWWVEFNYLASAPTSLDYVQYNYSQGPAKINGVANPVDWSVHYNVCDTGMPPAGGILKMNILDSTKTYYIGTNQYIIPPFAIGPFNCQGDITYTGYVDNSAYGTSTMYIDLISNDVDGTPIEQIQSVGFTVTQLPEIIESHGSIGYFGPNPLITNTATSSGVVDIPFDFNICGQTGWASDSFVLENLDTNTLTDIATSTPVACSGESHLYIAYGTSTISSLNARVDLVDASSSKQILGNSFAIILQTSNAGIKTTGTRSCDMPTFDIATECPEWNSSTSTLSIFTPQFLICGVQQATFWVTRWGFYPSCGSLYYVTDTFDKFKKVFPFNTYFDFIGTMDTAITSSLTSTTTTQTLDIPFIRKTATSSQYYMLPVMTTTSIPNTIGQTNYGTLRTTLGYIYWVVIGFIIFLMIKK